MMSERRRGDSYTNRLFQWITEEERFPFTLMMTIKPKIYKIMHNKRLFLLKGYRRPSVLTQQIELFSHWNYGHDIGARPVPFPDGEATKAKLGCEWGLFEWFEGRHADFSSAEDRKAAGDILRRFHRTTKGIGVLSVPKDPLYVKWERRLEHFEETKDVFLEYRKKNLYDEVRSCMLGQLERFSTYSWGEIEEQAWNRHEWLHGDVAHHNFLINQAGEIRLIDFDLLHTGPHVYDDIQLAQRFLPFVERSRSALFHHFNHVQNRSLWLQGVLVPADLLREWLYGYRRCQLGDASYRSYLTKLEKAWSSRKPFVRYAENML